MIGKSGLTGLEAHFAAWSPQSCLALVDLVVDAGFDTGFSRTCGEIGGFVIGAAYAEGDDRRRESIAGRIERANRAGYGTHRAFQQ